MSNDTVTLCTDLSISADDSSITTIPLVTLDAIWSKAIELLSTSSAITSTPGTQKKACMVLSYSQVTPHLIQAKSDGQYICDSNCQQWVPASCALTHLLWQNIMVIYYLFFNGTQHMLRTLTLAL